MVWGIDESLTTWAAVSIQAHSRPLGKEPVVGGQWKVAHKLGLAFPMSTHFRVNL